MALDPAPVEADREAMRHAMVASQLRTNAVSDARLIEAMARLPRENFLPAEHRGIAYRDTLLPLGGGRSHNSPLATARLLNAAEVRPGDHVLLIGAAGGYAAALLAALGATVVALEEDEALAAVARSALAGDSRIELVVGPLTAGWTEGGPYDLLVIDGAVEQVPDSIVAQLKPGGRAVSGVADRGITRLASGSRTEGGFGMMDFTDIECAVLPGFVRLRTFQF